jgi:tRNA(Glu) U13 pseudouridine synthase TruD
MGAYRPILVVPSEFTWRQIYYDSPGADLSPDPQLNPPLQERVFCRINDTEVSKMDALCTKGGGATAGSIEKKQKTIKKQRKRKKEKASDNTHKTPERDDDEKKGDDEKKLQKYTALQMSFCLPSGSYATMMMREIAKPQHHLPQAPHDGGVGEPLVVRRCGRKTYFD